MDIEGLDLGILGPAMMAGCIVLLTHVPLGNRVLQRGIIFIDLAIAQIAGLGVIAASTLFGANSGIVVQISAFSAALTGAIALHFCEKHWPDIQEAIIGCAFVLAATGSILLLSNDPHGGEQLHDLLSGQVLWVTYEQLWIPLIVSVLLFLLIRFRENQDGSLMFYLIFAIAVTTSVQLVGVYLVFASLIIPALFTRKATSAPLMKAGIIGLSGYAGGLLLSAILDLPTSPLIVWTLTGSGIAIALFTHTFESSDVCNDA